MAMIDIHFRFKSERLKIVAMKKIYATSITHKTLVSVVCKFSMFIQGVFHRQLSDFFIPQIYQFRYKDGSSSQHASVILCINPFIISSVCSHLFGSDHVDPLNSYMFFGRIPTVGKIVSQLGFLIKI